MKTKRKARKEKSHGKRWQGILILYQTVVTWKKRLIIRVIFTSFSPELWPLRARNLHRLSGEVQLCTIKQIPTSLFLITYILWFSLSACHSSGKYFYMRSRDRIISNVQCMVKNISTNVMPVVLLTVQKLHQYLSKHN
jgi:hypothetical protein